MKRVGIIFLFFVLSIYSFGQIVYQSSHYANIDSSYIFSKTNAAGLIGYDFSETGTAYNWDYSDLTITTQDQTTVINPDNSGYFESFILSCLANGGGFTCYDQWNDLSNLAFPSSDSLVISTYSFKNMIAFFNKTNTLSQTMLGVTFENDQISAPLPIVYDDPDIVLSFPLEYGDQDSSYSSFEIDLTALGIDFIYKNRQYRSNTIEGWGTLQTPYKVFNQVLKQKTILQHFDTIVYSGFHFPMVTQEIAFTFFDINYGNPVFKVKGNIIAGNNYSYQEASFIDTMRCLPAVTDFTAVPTTAFLDSNNQAQVFFLNFSNNCQNYLWDFGDGYGSEESWPTHTYTEDGNYVVKLKGCNTICNPVSCDSMELTIQVIDTNSNTIDEASITPSCFALPNPAKDFVELTYDKPISEFMLIDLLGNVRQTEIVSKSSNSCRLSLHNLEKGLYFLRYKQSNTVKLLKIIKI